MTALTTQCGSSRCEGLVFWATNDRTTKRAPIDAIPNAKGNITVDFSKDPPEYHVMTKPEMRAIDQGNLFEGEPPERFTSHFATCEEPEHYRRCHRCHKTPCVCGRR